MVQLFWLPFLLVHLAETGKTQEHNTCLIQPKTVIWKKIGENAILNCSVKSNCTPAKPQWFVVKTDSYQDVELTGKYKLNEGSLHISSLNVNDTGCYLCSASITSNTKDPCLPFVGEAATLVVGESTKLMVSYIPLWLLFTLLAIYSSALVMLIITKKHGYNLSLSKKTSKPETNSLKKKQFRNVLQELHSKANMNKRNQSTRGNASHAEAVSGDGNISTDDIYENA